MTEPRSPNLPRAAARAWHGALALTVLVGIAIQLWIVIDLPAHPSGHAVGVVAGTSLGGRLVRMISFFTIESNLLVGVVSAQLARDPDRDGPVWRVVRLCALFGITVTGIVYGTVLARVHEPHGWREVFSNALVHYAVPIGAVVGWLLFGPRPRITATTIGRALLWPVAWLAYTLVRGAATGWYPYPFLDVTTHGYPRVVLNAVAVTAVFALVCTAYAVGDRRLGSARGSGLRPVVVPGVVEGAHDE